MTRFARFAAAVVVVVFALSGGSAYAAYPDTPKGAQADCGAGNDPLSGHYSVAVLEAALKTLPTDDKEYSTCVDALESAIRADERGRTALPGSSHYVVARHPNHPRRPPPPKTHPAAPPTGSTGPISERIDAALNQGAQPQNIDGSVVTPGAVVTRDSGFLNSIPTPVLALLAALVAVLAGVGALAVRNVVRARRSY